MKKRKRLGLRVWGPAGWRVRVVHRLNEALMAAGWEPSIAWSDSPPWDPPMFELLGRLPRTAHALVVELLLMAFADVAWQEGETLVWADC